MLSLDFENQILELAVRKGLLEASSGEELDPGSLLDPKIVNASTLWGPRLDALMAVGRISKGSVERLAFELTQAGMGEALDSWMESPIPAKRGEALPPALSHRYQDLRLLGEGATAEVFKAFDTLLQRWVALKFLKWAMGESSDSILSEARAQAQVEHPNICRIYEVGEADGHGYIAMQLVEGPTLARAFEGMDAATQIQVVRDLAKGIHAAHARGLVHLDLKPGNVLLQRLEGGAWQPLITDFGMVRVVGIAEPGPSPMGTPPFSSPEQIRGQSNKVDRRSDVYSIGVLLYVLLTGKYPFEAEGFGQLLEAMSSGKPVPLRKRRPEFSEDLEAILLKCMEKDPALRYATALELSHDLDRFLDGAPVQARPLGPWARGVHRVRRSPRASALLALAALVFLGVVGVLARREYILKTQRFWTLEFGQETIRMESILHYGRMLKPHDINQEKALVMARMDGIRRRMADESAARGPGYWALGQGYLILGEGEKAQEEEERALGLGYDLGPVHLALGEALLMRYQEGLQDIATNDSVALRKEKIDALKGQYREPALGHLRMARTKRGIRFSSPQEVRLALAEERTQEAVTLAYELQAQEPWNYDPLLDVAEAKVHMALEHRDAGRRDEARSLFLEALQRLEIPAGVAPSDGRIHRLRGRIWYLAYELGLEGRSREASILESLRWADADLQVDSRDLDQMAQKAYLLALLGQWRAEAQQDPDAHLEPSETLCRAMLKRELPPRLLAQVHGTLLRCLFARSHFAKKGGRPFEALLKACIEHGRASLATGKAPWSTYSALALALKEEAIRAESSGIGDLLGKWSEAEQVFMKAVDLSPSTKVMRDASWVYFKDAEARLGRGEAPSSQIQQVFGLLERAKAKHPGFYDELFLRARGRMLQGSWALSQGEDPWRYLDDGLNLPESPADGRLGADRWCVMAELRLSRATACFELGRAAEGELRAAEDCLANVAAPPHDPREVPGIRADVLLLRTRIRIQNGQPSLPALQSANRILAGTRDPDNDAMRATLSLWEGWECLSQARAAEAPLKRARNIIERLSASEPDGIDTKLLQTRLHLLEAAVAGRDGRPAERGILEARRRLAEVSGRQPGNFEAQHLGGALEALAAFLSGKDPASEAAKRALADTRHRAGGLSTTYALGLLLEQRAWTPEEEGRVRAIDPMLAFLHTRIAKTQGR